MSEKHDIKRLYKLAYDLKLLNWHFSAAQILYHVNGYISAETFLRQCGDRQSATSAIPAEWSNPYLLSATATATPDMDDFQIIDDWLPVGITGKQGC